MIGMFDYEELAFNTIQHLYIWDITDGTMSKQRVDILVRAFANNDVLQTLLISSMYILNRLLHFNLNCSVLVLTSFTFIDG